jgi:HEAT repeat protein
MSRDKQGIERFIDESGQVGNVRAIEPLTTLLDAADVALRVRAVRALRQIGGPTAIEALASALQNTMPQVRRAAIVALGKLRDERCLMLLIGALDDADTRVCLSVVLTLAELGDARALPALTELREREESHIDDSNEARQICELADYALRRIQRQSLK